MYIHTKYDDNRNQEHDGLSYQVSQTKEDIKLIALTDQIEWYMPVLLINRWTIQLTHQLSTLNTVR